MRSATAAQQLVAGAVAEAVVDDLEAVEVEEQHRDRATRRPRPRRSSASFRLLMYSSRLGSPVSGSRNSWFSLVRQATMCATLAASTNPPWMPAQTQGCATAAGSS